MFQPIAIHRTPTPITAIILALVWMGSSHTASAQCCGGMGGHDHGGHVSDDHDAHSVRCQEAPAPSLKPQFSWTPHGGQFLNAGDNALEYVYLPHEIRVYLYGKSLQPLSTRQLQGQITLQTPGTDQHPQTALHYRPQPSGTTDQDYLAAPVDGNTLVDGQTAIHFDFRNLPDRRHPTASFAPIFLRTMVRPYVVEVATTPADREAIAAQQTCPVTGAKLGSMGPVVKLLVGDRPLYVCCAGCVERVREVETLRAQSQ